MIDVVLAGESGNVTEVLEIGPATLVRHRTWANLEGLAEACVRGGLTARVLGCGPVPDGLASPAVWLLSDMPFLAAEAFGLLDRLSADVPTTSGLFMIGGAFSFSGLKAVGGWQDPRGASLLPVLLAGGADDTEAPDGIRVVPTAECPDALASLLSAAPAFYGYNRVQVRDGSLVLARFENGGPALVVSAGAPRRSVAFASDLLPHWGPSIAAWAGLPALMRALCDLAAGEA